MVIEATSRRVTLAGTTEVNIPTHDNGKRKIFNNVEVEKS